MEKANPQTRYFSGNLLFVKNPITYLTSKFNAPQKGKEISVMGDIMAMDDQMLSVQETQEYLRIGRNTMYKLLKIDGFPCIRIGSRCIISKTGLDKWVQKNMGHQILL